MNTLNRILSEYGIEVAIEDETGFMARGKGAMRISGHEGFEKYERLFERAVKRIIEIERWIITDPGNRSITVEVTPVFINRDIVLRSKDHELAFTCKSILSQIPTKYVNSEAFMPWLLGHEMISGVRLGKILYLTEADRVIEGKVKTDLKRVVAEWLIEELTLQYERDSNVPAAIIKNIFISGPVYEMSFDDDSINVFAYNPIGDAYGAEYTPYPTAIRSMDFKRYRTGSIVPSVIEIEMDNGWAIAARVTLLQNSIANNVIQIAFSLTDVPSNRTKFSVSNDQHSVIIEYEL